VYDLEQVTTGISVDQGADHGADQRPRSICTYYDKNTHLIMFYYANIEINNNSI